MYSVDSGIPTPNPLTPGRKGKYPWHKMQVGDSVFIAGQSSSKSDKTKKSGAINSARCYGSRSGIKFTARCDTVDGVEGVRIWRTK